MPDAAPFPGPGPGPVLVVSAHAADFVWRAGGYIALAAQRGPGPQRGPGAHVVCLSYGERGESAALWKRGLSLDEVKATRRAEAEAAAKILGALSILTSGSFDTTPPGRILASVASAVTARAPPMLPRPARRRF